jgi:thioredoxin reductase
MDGDGLAANVFDIAIVGGGPAGLSAAIWSARYLHSTVLVDSGDPRNWQTRGIQGYLGLPSITPADLRARGRAECREFGVHLVDGIVLRADVDGPERFCLALNGGERLYAHRLLLAIGIRDVWPDIPGLERVFGSNAHVCPDCDGYLARGRKVVVIGTGRRAVGMALDLTTWTRDIIICTNGRPPDLDEAEYCDKLDALEIPVITERVAQVCYRGTEIESLRLENGMQLDTDKLFFTLAQYPADDLGAQLGCARDDEGHVEIDEHHHTSVEHVFAAGDIAPGPQLAIRAAQAGAVAALSMHKSLVPAARKLLPRRAVPTSAE